MRTATIAARPAVTPEACRALAGSEFPPPPKQLLARAGVPLLTRRRWASGIPVEAIALKNTRSHAAACRSE